MLGKDHVIKGLKKCDFTPMYDHAMAEREKKKALSKEVKFFVWTALHNMMQGRLVTLIF